MGAKIKRQMDATVNQIIKPVTIVKIRRKIIETIKINRSIKRNEAISFGFFCKINLLKIQSF